MTTQELIDYYAGLIILQYGALPNATATVQAFIRSLVQDQIISMVRDGFDLDTAIGAQLNILGTYRGANRVVFGAAPGTYWSLVPYADAAPGSYLGWAEYNDADPTWRTIQYNDINSLASSLTDSQLRRLIKFRAAVQSSDQTLGSLDSILYSFFSTYVNLLDNLDMTMQYIHSHTDPDTDGIWNILVLTDSLPHPAGVAFSVVEV